MFVKVNREERKGKKIKIENYFILWSMCKYTYLPKTPIMQCFHYIQRGHQPFYNSYKICWKIKLPKNCDKWTLSLCKVLCSQKHRIPLNKWMKIWRKTYYGTWKKMFRKKCLKYDILKRKDLPKWNFMRLCFFLLFGYGWVFHCAAFQRDSLPHSTFKTHPFFNCRPHLLRIQNCIYMQVISD